VIFLETKIRGALLIEPERLEDERGFFARAWSEREFETRGLNPRLVECSLSFNVRRGTLRGMHYQIEPYREAKLVRCTMGAIYDVILDLRRDSKTFKEWLAVDLTAESRKMLYIPEGVAHGFQTLVDNTEVFYQISEVHNLESARGVRWDDAEFGVIWPIRDPIMSLRDGSYPDFGE